MVRPEKVRGDHPCVIAIPLVLILVLSHRPYLHMYAHSNEVEEIGVISLNGVNIESNPDMEALLGVSGRLPHAFDRRPKERSHSRAPLSSI